MFGFVLLCWLFVGLCVCLFCGCFGFVCDLLICLLLGMLLVVVLLVVVCGLWFVRGCVGLLTVRTLYWLLLLLLEFGWGGWFGCWCYFVVVFFGRLFVCLRECLLWGWFGFVCGGLVCLLLRVLFVVVLLVVVCCLWCCLVIVWCCLVVRTLF